MNVHRYWLRLFGSLLGLMLLIPTSVSATITDCGGQSGFKVYLDEPLTVGDRTPNVQFFLQELYFLFEDRKELEWVEWLPEGDAGSISFVLCKGRQPAIDGSDFKADFVDLLYNNDVLVELIASLSASGDRDGIALLQFVVVPVRKLHFERSGPPDGIFKARHRTSGEPEEFVELFKRVRDIDAYVAAGLGVKASRQRNYAAAQKGLCRGLASLPANASPALVQLLSELAADNIRSAKADTDYRGALILFDPAEPCPEGQS